jgi:hypothetical protein
MLTPETVAVKGMVVGLGVKLAVDANKVRKQQNSYPS